MSDKPSPYYAIVNIKHNTTPVKAIEYFADTDKVTGFYNGLELGTPEGQSPKELTDLLLAEHHDRRVEKVARSVVISVKTPRNATKEQLADIDARLLRCARDLQKFLRVVQALGWIHANTRTRHLHMIFANSTGRKTLDLNPKFLRRIQDFKWTIEFLSGRGKGERGTCDFNPKAPGLKVTTLATILMDRNGELKEDRWQRLIAEGNVSDFRYRNDGTIISFKFGKKRMRINTLRQIMIDRKGKPMSENEVSQVEAQLHECGWTSADVQAVLQDIRDGLAGKPSEMEQLIQVINTVKLS